jgi:hypothetical protein
MKNLFTGFVVFIILFLGACDWNNSASDDGIDQEYTSPLTALDSVTWANYNKDTLNTGRAVDAHVCCAALDGNDGGAAYAIDGNTADWWHTIYGSTPGFSAYDGRGTSDGHQVDDHYVYGLAVEGKLTDPNLDRYYPDTYSTLQVKDLVPPNGAHWITMDLGEVCEINRLGYTRRPAVTNENHVNVITLCEVWVSEEDFGWDTSHAVLAASGAIAANDAVQYIYFEKGTPPARYVQLRARYADSAGGYAGAANITLQSVSGGGGIPFTGTDTGFLGALYLRGRQFRDTMDKTNFHYKKVADAVEAARALLADPRLSGSLTGQIQIQEEIDDRAAELQEMLDELSPYPEPPEVTE